MARKATEKAKPTNNEKAIAAIIGVVAGYYDKGKKYDYVTIDVHHDYDEYYDRFKVAVNKSFDCPDDGEPIAVECTMKNYKGDVSFKEIHADDDTKN